MTGSATTHAALFAALPAAGRDELELAFRREEHAAGTVVLREGDEGDRYLLLEEGEVEVWAARDGADGVPAQGEPWAPDPETHALVSTLGPGDGVGEMALILGGARRASVRAVSSVVARALDRAAFERVLAEQPALLLGLEAEVAIRQASLFLGERSPFAGQPPELLRWLALRMATVEAPAGEEVVRAGDPGDAFFVVRAGRVEVLGERTDGTSYRIAELGPGDPFGEQALLSAGTRTATVRALEPVVLLRLGRDDFEAILARHADRAQYLFLLARQRARPRRVEHVDVAPAAGADGVYVLKDTRRFRYLRLSEPGLFLWNLMDGEHTVRDLSIAYFRRYRRLGVDAVLQTISELHVAGFVEVPDVDERILRTATRLGVVERATRRAAPWIRRSFSLPDPDRALGLLYRFVFRPLYLVPVQLALLAAALAGAVLFARAVIGGQTGGAGAGGFALAALVALELQVVLHELGHALTTKHFGREVHSVGVGWYFLTPVAFVDTSDMWLESRRRRMAVAAAGPVVNLVVSGLAGCALPFADGSARSFLLVLATTGYVLALLNLNPLYELDGYYVLSDWLDVANLRAKALAFVGARIWRGGRKTSDRRLARIFAWYGIAALVYALLSAAFLFVSYHRLAEHVVARALPAGIAAALGWTLAAVTASLLLANLWQALRRGAGGREAVATG